MRPSRHVRMNCHREDELVVLAVKVVKMVTPNILNIPTPIVNYPLITFKLDAPTDLGFTQPCELAEFFINIMGGRSSIYHEPGISTMPVGCPLISGFIHSSAFFE